MSGSSTRRVGLLARATDQGLGTQTWNFFQGYKPDATLVLRCGHPMWPDHLKRYPHAWVADLKRERDRDVVDSADIHLFLAQIDVLFTVETLYSWPFASRLRNSGVHTVIQGNPEFYRPPDAKGSAPHPHEWVWPTGWLLDKMPEGKILPVPVTGTSTAKAGDPWSGPLTFVHVAGRRAIGDRNGTDVLCDALRYLKATCHVRIVSQDGQIKLPDILPPNVTVDVHQTGFKDRWQLYDGAHVLVLPRIYGGLSLPVQEAMESGLAVLMTDCPPNREWPIVPIPASVGPSQRTPGGHMRTHVCRARDVAHEMDRLSMNRDLVVEAQAAARTWASEHTWDILRPRYDEVLR